MLVCMPVSTSNSVLAVPAPKFDTMIRPDRARGPSAT